MTREIGEYIIYFHEGSIFSGYIWHIEWIDDGGTRRIEYAVNVTKTYSKSARSHFIFDDAIISNEFFQNIKTLDEI